MTLWYISAVLALILAILVIHNIGRSGELDDREEKLDKYNVALDERANRLAELESYMLAPPPSVSRAVVSDEFVPLKAQYIVSESDEMRYNTDAAIKRNAKNQLAFTIASDIVKSFEPTESFTEEGRKRYSYELRVKK